MNNEQTIFLQPSGNHHNQYFGSPEKLRLVSHLGKNSPDPFHGILPQFRKHDLQRLDLLRTSRYVRFNWFPVSKVHIHPTLSQRHPEAMEAIHHYFSSAKLVLLPGPGRAWGCECWNQTRTKRRKLQCSIALLLKH